MDKNLSKLIDLEQFIEHDHVRIHLTNLTAGNWLPDQVIVPEWSHYLILVVPKFQNAKMAGKALLYSTEQLPSGQDMVETGPAQFVISIAMQTGSVTGLLYGNPFGPIKFKDEPDVESFGQDLLAKSWNRTISSEQPEVFPELFLFMNQHEYLL